MDWIATYSTKNKRERTFPTMEEITLWAKTHKVEPAHEMSPEELLEIARELETKHFTGVVMGDWDEAAQQLRKLAYKKLKNKKANNN